MSAPNEPVNPNDYIPAMSELIPFPEVRRRALIIGKTGRGCSTFALKAYCDPKRGCKTQRGVVILRAWKLGKCLFTTQRAIDEFNRLRLLGSEILPQEPQPKEPSPRSRKSAQRHADEFLRSRGVI